MISGKPVTPETSSTLRPASRSVLAVPPVETRAMPRSESALAKSTSPVLSDTESNARRMGRSVMGLLGRSRIRPCLLPEQPKEKGQNDADQQRRNEREIQPEIDRKSTRLNSSH